MNLTQQDALESLSAVEQAMAQARRALAHAGAPYYLLLWGGIWLVGFLIEQFASPRVVGWSWLVLDVVGGVLSFWIGYRQSLRVRSRVLGPRIGLFWLALIVYGVAWVWVAAPTDGRQLSLMIALMAMFGYVVMGLWLRVNGTIVLGVAISVLAVLAYLWVPQWFYLVMALIGGGVLIFSGWWMLTRWRV